MLKVFKNLGNSTDILTTTTTSAGLLAASTMAPISATTVGLTGYITQDTMDKISFLPVLRHIKTSA
jgi:hypothetical protein